jgi:hypothetical protein
MSTAITPVAPWALKEILCAYGLRVVYEDDWNWILDEPNHPEIEPITVPKIGETVAVDVMMDTLMNAKIGFGTYQSLKEKVLAPNWHSLSPEAQAEIRKKYLN